MATMALFETGFAVDAHQPASSNPNGTDPRKRKRTSAAASAEGKAAQAAEATINLEKLMKQLEETNEDGSSNKKRQRPSKGGKNTKAATDEEEITIEPQAPLAPPKKQAPTLGDVKPERAVKENKKAAKEGSKSATPKASGAPAPDAAAPTDDTPKLSKKEKQKQKADASKAAYIPSEADIAKREERKKKKELKGKAVVATDAADDDEDTADAPAAAAPPAAEDAEMEVEEPTASSSAPAQPSPAMTQLQKFMAKKLGGARFRWINEQLYTTSGERAYELMREDPSMFEEYHSGFRSQAASWPSQPINLFIDSFNRDCPASSSSTNGKPVIADLGCGDAQLAKSLVPKGFTVLSYDLISKNDWVVESQCSKHVPLPGSNADDAQGSGGSVVDVVVCCLSLMGHDWINMVKEARRITKMGGKLRIAEVTSRFTDIDGFVELVKEQGFKLNKKDTSNTHFATFDFTKVPIKHKAKVDAGVGAGKKGGKASKVAAPAEQESEGDALLERSAKLLKPCLYKKR